MSAARVTVLDFTKGVVATTSYDEFHERMILGCRKAGHVFVTGDRQAPVSGQRCICGDTTWPRTASAGSTERKP